MHLKIVSNEGEINSLNQSIANNRNAIEEKKIACNELQEKIEILEIEKSKAAVHAAHVVKEMEANVNACGLIIDVCCSAET